VENDWLEDYENGIVDDVMGYLHIQKPTEFQNPDADLGKIEKIWRDEPLYYNGAHWVGETQAEEPRSLPAKFVSIHETAGRQVWVEGEFDVRMRGRMNRILLLTMAVFAGAVILLIVIRGG